MEELSHPQVTLHKCRVLGQFHFRRSLKNRHWVPSLCWTNSQLSKGHLGNTQRRVSRPLAHHHGALSNPPRTRSDPTEPYQPDFQPNRSEVTALSDAEYFQISHHRVCPAFPPNLTIHHPSRPPKPPHPVTKPLHTPARIARRRPGAKCGDIGGRAAFPRLRTGHHVQPQVAANIGNDLGHRPVADVILDIGGIQPLEKFGMQAVRLIPLRLAADRILKPPG